jgi:hypothetical protein
MLRTASHSRIQSFKGKGRVREERMDVLALRWARDEREMGERV